MNADRRESKLGGLTARLPQASADVEANLPFRFG